MLDNSEIISTARKHTPYGLRDNSASNTSHINPNVNNHDGNIKQMCLNPPLTCSANESFEFSEKIN